MKFGFCKLKQNEKGQFFAEYTITEMLLDSIIRELRAEAVGRNGTQRFPPRSIRLPSLCRCKWHVNSEWLGQDKS
jgi:hypothetical protein